LTIEKRGVRPPYIAYSYRFQTRADLIVVEAGMKLSSSVVAPDDVVTNDPFEAFFDVEKLPRTLTVRNFRPGDRLRPLGMTGQKKVKDLFIDKKMSLEARATLPLLFAGDEIAWIPGCARSRIALITAGTQSVLRVSARPLR
jgi:tRNA(Ile)-lysidine synthase